eukprot:6193870-Pleurochrysis_carterae.AAC.1
MRRTRPGLPRLNIGAIVRNVINLDFAEAKRIDNLSKAAAAAARNAVGGTGAQREHKQQQTPTPTRRSTLGANDDGMTGARRRRRKRADAPDAAALGRRQHRRGSSAGCNSRPANSRRPALPKSAAGHATGLDARTALPRRASWRRGRSGAPFWCDPHVVPPVTIGLNPGIENTLGDGPVALRDFSTLD